MEMKIDIISVVPNSMQSYIDCSIIKRAREKGKVEINLIDLKDYSNDKLGRVDDYPYGGGAGMLIKCEPMFNCIESLQSITNYDEIIYLTADGKTLNQAITNELSLSNNLLLIAGHYKGIDQRIRDYFVTKEISIGDFVLTGGELPALILMDSIVRLIPGVISNSEASLTDSFMNGLLEEPQYTRPAEFKEMKVPEVLLSGNHKLINEWREESSYKKTIRIRPDLLDES